MKDYKENFHNAVEYATQKTKANVWKLILLGIMGSIYVGIAYIAFIYIIASFDGVIVKVLDSAGAVIGKKVNIHGGALIAAAAIFPVGIILIVFLGGSLFTSDNLTSLAVITKRIKLMPVVMKWIYTLLGNILGAILIAGIIRAGNIFAGENQQLILGYLSGKKIHSEWYYTFFSAILCNIIVAGSVWATLAAKHSSAKIFLLYFPIWLFGIVGFQHVVANAILFAMAWFYSIAPTEQNTFLLGLNLAANDVFKYIPDNAAALAAEMAKKEWVDIGGFSFFAIFGNLLPSALGNWFSGAILLPFTYYWLSSYKKIMKNTQEISLPSKEPQMLEDQILKDQVESQEKIDDELENK